MSCVDQLQTQLAQDNQLLSELTREPALYCRNQCGEDINCIKECLAGVPGQIAALKAEIAFLTDEINLIGTWSCDDGGVYYFRQDGTEVWWLGLSQGQDSSQLGLNFTNIFHGTRSQDGNTISGVWFDVPRGQTCNNGTITLVRTGNSQFQAQAKTGGFSGSVWNKVG